MDSRLRVLRARPLVETQTRCWTEIVGPRATIDGVSERKKDNCREQWKEGKKKAHNRHEKHDRREKDSPVSLSGWMKDTGLQQGEGCRKRLPARKNDKSS